MKKSLMILGLAALVLATSCEREENLNKVDNETPQTFEGDVAYIVVNINDVNNSSTRATSSGFEYGSSAEYAIYDAHFYFYDSYGEYVAESDSESMTGTATDNPSSGGDIEFKANTVITLHGLSGTNYPNWVVTVLNQPLGFVAPIKLEDFPATLAETTEGQGTLGEHGIFSKGVGLWVESTSTMYYTMSTSSFVPEGDQVATDTEPGYSSTYYFATPVVPENFSLEDLTTDANGNYVGADGETAVPVEIYVERLVAKTRMSTDLSGGTYVEFTYTEYEYDENGDVTDSTDYKKSGYAYPITVQEEASDDEGALELEEDVTLYVYLDGWRLNGISTDSYISKRIDTSWGTASPYGWGWNDATNYRSYWAMSTAYGDNNAQWPDSSEGYDYGDAKDELNDYLRWVDLQQAYLKPFSGTDDVEYCAENTNTAGAPNAKTASVITSAKSVAITNALVKAFIGRYEGGVFTPLDLVRVGGVIYTKENYCVYAASHIHLYTRESDGGTPATYTYTLIGPNDLVVVDDNDGYVHVEIDPELAETTLYVDTEGTTLASTGYDGSEGNTVNDYIDDHFNEIYGYDANGYTGGMMYYTIPIQHLNDDYTQTYLDDGEYQTLVLEGNYGMVRNHIYDITITGVENIGWGIYNPEEVIIPQEEADTYAITANINILSWKLVEQSVVL